MPSEEARKLGEATAIIDEQAHLRRREMRPPSTSLAVLTRPRVTPPHRADLKRRPQPRSSQTIREGEDPTREDQATERSGTMIEDRDGHRPLTMIMLCSSLAAKPELYTILRHVGLGRRAPWHPMWGGRRGACDTTTTWP